MKSAVTYIVILALFGALFGWTQNQILAARKNFRTDEKILMVSDRPEVTKILALGFDNAVADLMWIRAIQYFGGNFSTLDVQLKRDGLMNLFNNLIGLDPHFLEAYKFAGFVINESMNDPQTAMNFLINGADSNPQDWKLPFDAGFIGFYQLEQFEVAKDLFIRSVYGTAYNDFMVVESNGLVSSSSVDALLDGDTHTSAEFNTEGGMFVLAFDEKKDVGRIVVEQQSGSDESYRLQYQSRSVDSYIDKETISISGVAVHSFDPAVLTGKIKFDQFTTNAESGLFSISDIKMYGERNPETPSYVERMIFEMDRASGRFLAAWEQYQRYYQEAVDKGDTISAELALKKLDDIYSAKSIQLLEPAVKRYIDAHNGALPSPDMHELIEEGFLQQVIEEEKAADPQFEAEVMRVLIPRDGSLYDIMTGMDGQTQHILLPSMSDDTGQDWYLASKKDLINDREVRIKTITAYVDQYKIEYNNKIPASLEELMKETWVSISEDLLKDPLGGEYYIDPETGEVKVRNSKF